MLSFWTGSDRLESCELSCFFSDELCFPRSPDRALLLCAFLTRSFTWSAMSSYFSHQFVLVPSGLFCRIIFEIFLSNNSISFSFPAFFMFGSWILEACDSFFYGLDEAKLRIDSSLFKLSSTLGRLRTFLCFGLSPS